MQLADSVALVTGGASGLGAATVRRLVAGGAKVVIVDRDLARGAALADELGADRARFVQADVTDAAQIEAAIAARDHYDSTRADSPLTLADGSIVVDTTGLGIDEVLEHIESLMSNR